MLWSRSVACDFWSATNAANMPAISPLASISTSRAVMMAMPDSLDFDDVLIACLVSGESVGAYRYLVHERHAAQADLRLQRVVQERHPRRHLLR